MIKFNSIQLASSANPRSESGSSKTISANRKKKVVSDITLSVVEEKVKDEATGLVVGTGRLKTIFKLSKEGATKIDLQNVVGTVPVDCNAIITLPKAQADSSSILFREPKGTNPMKSRNFRAIVLVKALIATGQIPTTFGQSINDVAYFNFTDVTSTVEEFPLGYKWFSVDKVESGVASVLAPVTVSDSASNFDASTSKTPVTSSTELVQNKLEEDEEELGDEDSQDAITEEEEDPFA